MAAIIALIKSDIENAAKIAEAIDENLSIDPSYLEAIMAIYEYFTPTGSRPKDYDPKSKLFKMRKYINPLLPLYNINDRRQAVFVIRLTQGDA